MDRAENSLSPAEVLTAAGLRPTRQRLALTALVFGRGDRHLTAESLHDEAAAAGVPVALATVYNTLRRFTQHRLMREVMAAPGKVYFDTNVTEHHHFFHEESGVLADIPAGGIVIEGLPPAPDGAEVRQVDIIVRLGAAKA